MNFDVSSPLPWFYLDELTACTSERSALLFVLSLHLLNAFDRSLGGMGRSTDRTPHDRFTCPGFLGGDKWPNPLTKYHREALSFPHTPTFIDLSPMSIFFSRFTRLSKELFTLVCDIRMTSGIHTQLRQLRVIVHRTMSRCVLCLVVKLQATSVSYGCERNDCG